MSGSGKECAAIVLDCQDYGESDQIVTFYCRDIGRMTGIAKGAKRSRKRFVNKLELFSSLVIQYSEARNAGMAFIAGADLVESFLRLRQESSLYLMATVMRELTLVATRELDGDDGYFSLLHWGLRSLDAKRSPLTVLVLFVARFFAQIGYRPDLRHCLACRQVVPPTSVSGFDGKGGGVICCNCSSDRQGLLTISAGTLKFLEAAWGQPLDRLHRLGGSGAGLREALLLLHQYGRHVLQREIYSLKLLAANDWAT